MADEENNNQDLDNKDISKNDSGGEGDTPPDADENNANASEETGNTSQVTDEVDNDEESKKDDESNVDYDGVTLPEDLPEGMQLDTELFDQAKSIADKHNMPKEALQEIVNLYANKAIDSNNTIAKEWEQVEQRWQEETRNDSEIGGDKYDLKVEKAKRAISVFGTPELMEALDSTRAGNHPEFIRLLSRIGEKITEDGGFDAGNSTTTLSRGEIMFDNS